MYQVWTKQDFQELWELIECDTLAEVEEIIRTNFTHEVEVRVSLPIKYDARIAVKIEAPREEAPARSRTLPAEKEQKQEVSSEASQGGPQEDKGPGGKGVKRHGSGDSGAVSADR